MNNYTRISPEDMEKEKTLSRTSTTTIILKW